MKPSFSAILIILSALFLMGTLMVFNTTSADLLDHRMEVSHSIALFKQLIYSVVGIASALAVKRFGIERVQKYHGAIFLLMTLSLVGVFVPGIGKQANGAYRWMGFAGLSLQPSEFAKLLVPLFLVGQFGDKKRLTFKKFIVKIFPIGIPLALIWLQPDHSTVVVIGLLVVATLFLLEVDMRYWALPMVLAAIVGSTIAINTPYVAARIDAYLNPTEDLLGKGHQPHQAKVATGSGGFLGKGPGRSFQKLSFLPEAHNDYIAAIYAEEFGFLGMILMITGYGALLYAGFAIAVDSPNHVTHDVAVVVTLLLSLQAFLNLGVVSGLLPSTGLNLPFFSQGGSSLLANAFGIGLLLDCSVSNYRATVRKSP